MPLDPVTASDNSSKAESMKLSLFDLLDHYPERGASLEARYRDHLDRAVFAERLGFHGIFVAEHHFSDFGAAPNPAVFLAAVAARTDRIRLGPAVAVLPFRHPLQVVEDYAMVDQLSGGRLVLGVGSGSEASEFRGFDLDPAAKRAAFDDRLPVVEAAFTGRTSDDGAPAPVAGARADAPPIYLAATSPAGARAAGIGGFGLLTLASPGTPSIDEVTARVEAYRAGQHRRQRAARTDGVIVTVLCHLADDDARARREAAPALERFLRAHGGADDDGFAVYDGMVARGVGAFGTPETVAETLEPLAVAGVDHFCLWMGFGDLDRDLFSRSMELAPRLRELLTGHRWADAATTA